MWKNGSGWSTASKRFWAKVEKTDTCWLWRGNQFRNGYGYFGVSGSVGRLAHRFSYEELVGEIPTGLTIDHLCRIRACVNPAHLEAVTLAENIRRIPHPNSHKTHCPHGHEYSGENLYVVAKTGARQCRECVRAKSREWQRTKRRQQLEQILKE